MADRIYDLTNDASPLDTSSFVMDDATYADAKSITYAQLETAIQADLLAADAAIIDGAGLETDGSFQADPTSTYLTNANFLAAGYDVNIKNGLSLLDSAVSTVYNNGVLEVQFDLTEDEVKLLGNKILKVAAPGAGNYFRIFGVDGMLDFNTTAYSSAGSKGVYVRFAGAADYIAELDKAFLESAATVTASFPVVRHNMPANTGIEVIAPDGNPRLGDSNIYIKLHYKLQTEMTSGGTGSTGGCCVSPLEGSFVNADLTPSGNLVINHAQVTQSLVLVVIDNTGTQFPTVWVAGDESGADPNNYITAPIGLGIAGTWHYFIIASR